MQRYKELQLIGDGTFGTVSKAINKETGDIVAIKKIKKKIHCWDGCTALREIHSLRQISHPNVVKITELIRESNSHVYLVFEYMDDGNLYEYMKRSLSECKDKGVRGGGGQMMIDVCNIRNIIKQILHALEYMHSKGYFHRDIKPENILLRGNVIKLADFGLAREIRSLPPYTDYVSTRWYRAPEVLLRSPTYSSPVDLFAVGCIISELYTFRPLFPGNSEIDQIYKIITLLGSPSEQSWPEGIALASRMEYNFFDNNNNNASSSTDNNNNIALDKIIPQASKDALELIKGLLILNPNHRLNANQALKHSYFNNNDDTANINNDFNLKINDHNQKISLLPSSSSSSPERKKIFFHDNWNKYGNNAINAYNNNDSAMIDSSSTKNQSDKKDWFIASSSSADKKPSTSSTAALFDNIYDYDNNRSVKKQNDMQPWFGSSPSSPSKNLPTN